VVSLTFLEAWRLRERVDTSVDASLLPWLLGITTNVSRNVRRAARRYDGVLARLPNEGLEPDIADEVVARIDDREKLALVRVALQALRKSEREVLSLCVWSGLEYAEAAEALGVPVGTVRSRLSRVRKKLAKLVATGKLRPPEEKPELPASHGQVTDDRAIAGPVRSGELSMNTIPNEREELARLLPESVEQELPSDRRQRLQEFVMSHLQQDFPPAPKASRRRPVFIGVAIAAVAIVAVGAIAIAVTTTGSAVNPKGGSDAPITADSKAAASMSGPQVLLAAATTAEKTPESSGAYWHVRTVSRAANGATDADYEQWTDRTGQTWYRSARKFSGRLIKDDPPSSFHLAGAEVSLAQIEKLPTEPNALKAWLSNALKHSNARTSAGRPDAKMQQVYVFDGLISLVSTLPSSPKVRAAAFRAIASYPDVHSVGEVKGGHALQIGSSSDAPKLVVDPTTGRVRETNVFVTAEGADYLSQGGATIDANWTNMPPQ
jgi:RNA polymerase sigma factor (sigma-70 family)